MKEKLLVTISGGRSSGYMAIKLHKEYKQKFDMHFVFANTGQEHPKTIEFIKNIRDHFGIDIRLLEADVKDANVGTKYKEVNFETLSMNGEPFEDVIKKYGLPNSNYMHCTRELKISPMNYYMKKHGIKKRTLGIRYDEPNRYHPKDDIYYPLWEWKETKESINRWWSEQSFDLEIQDYLGNCLTCHKKSDRKLNIIACEHPEYFDFYKRMETKYPDSKRQIFRGYRTTQDVLDGKVYDLFNHDLCAEECGSVLI
jgi:hypothetical protein